MARIAEVVKLKPGYANLVVLKEAFEKSQENADNDGTLHAAMEVFGVCGRWRRNPYQDATKYTISQIR